MDELLDQLFTEIPLDFRDAVMALAGEDPKSVTWLRSYVQAYLYEVRDVWESRRYLDMDFELAQRCGEACQKLLDVFENTESEGELRLLHAACRYFVLADDEEQDFESMLGYDDDAIVINVVAKILGRPECVISLNL